MLWRGVLVVSPVKRIEREREVSWYRERVKRGKESVV